VDCKAQTQIFEDVSAVDADRVYNLTGNGADPERLLGEGVSIQAVLLGGLAVLALTPACVGIYGVMAYMVTQENHEIGGRVALGAEPRNILRLILGHASKLTVSGRVSDFRCSPYNKIHEYSTFWSEPDGPANVRGCRAYANDCRARGELSPGPPGHARRSDDRVAMRITASANRFADTSG